MFSSVCVFRYYQLLLTLSANGSVLVCADIKVTQYRLLDLNMLGYVWSDYHLDAVTVKFL